MFGDLVDADEGVDPPLLRFLVNLALAHDEARVQPAVAVVLSQQFEPRDDRAPRPRPLLDALPVDGQEDVGVVRGPNDAAQVRRPHAVLSSARGIGPSDGSLQHVARDRPIARAEPRPLQSAERSGPRSIGVPHRQEEQSFESHGPVPQRRPWARVRRAFLTPAVSTRSDVGSTIRVGEGSHPHSGMRKTLRVLVIALLLGVAAVLIPATSAGLPASQALDRSGATIAGAGGVWDPDDVTGRFDLRWVGAAYTSTGELHLSVSFHDGFKRRFLPRQIDERHSHVSVGLGTVDGWFLRQHGRIVFIWGDFGSSCCERAGVRRPSSKVLSVVFDPCSYVYGNEIDQTQGESYWRPRGTRSTDLTGVVHLAHPNCDS
jgi:hypothetical protein